jgi:hypothetical protein
MILEPCPMMKFSCIVSKWNLDHLWEVNTTRLLSNVMYELNEQLTNFENGSCLHVMWKCTHQ